MGGAWGYDPETMSEVTLNLYAVLLLGTVLPKGEPGDIDTVLYSELQLVKCGSYTNEVSSRREGAEYRPSRALEPLISICG